MAVTPLDVLHKQFKTTFRGYAKAEVDKFLQSAREALEEALREKSELKRQLDAMQEHVDRVRALEASMTGALTLAQKAADKLKAGAHQQAKMILREAEQTGVKIAVQAENDAQKFRMEIALLQSTKDRFESEFRSVLVSYIEWLDRHKSGEQAREEVA